MSPGRAAASLESVTPADLAAATPPDRDRYVDLLRVASLAVVVAGHWLMAVLVVGADGRVEAANLLALRPELQPLTWLLQVMPVFFLVGGFAHATGVASLERRGGSYADWARARAARLLRPVAVFLGVWLVLSALAEATGAADAGVVRLALRVVTQPLWFVGVYLGVAALAPVLLRLHRRHGAAVVAVLAAGVALVDLARFGWGVPHVGYLNVALVWLAVHQAGFCYADGSLQRGGRWLAAALAGAGLAAAVALTAGGPYPLSMVGLPGEAVSNMSPPTLALLAHATWLVGAVLLVRPAADRWLRRPRVWAAVVAGNRVAMTAFLWHLTALFLLAGALLAVGVRPVSPDSPLYGPTRPVQVAALAAVTAGLVAAFRGFDAAPRAVTSTLPAGPSSDRLAAAGSALAVLGVLGFSASGVAGLLAPPAARLVVVPVSPLVDAALLAAGVLLLRRSAPLAWRRGPVLPHARRGGADRRRAGAASGGRAVPGPGGPTGAGGPLHGDGERGLPAR